jgi:hypothetical protein
MKIGDVVRDKISGLQGVVTCRVEFITGCVRWRISPQEVDEGEFIEPQYFDAEELEEVDVPKIITSSAELEEVDVPKVITSSADDGPYWTRGTKWICRGGRD